MFFSGHFPYYLTIGLQALCVIHCVRRNKLGWIWLIVFLPVVGSLVYLFMEVFSNRSSFNVNTTRINVGAVINPGGRIKKLEENLRFTDTFQNRVLLADAYLQSGQTDKAIDLYESSLTGAFSENEQVLAQLTIAYYQAERYADAIKAAEKIHKLPQFPRSQAHMYYAMSLEEAGQLDKADAEFKSMTGRYSYYEQRYQYGMFLLRNDRKEEAAKVFNAMLDEEPHLGNIERKNAKGWCNMARAALKGMSLPH